MPKIELDRQTAEKLSRLVSNHLKDEFEVEIEPFDSLSFLTFLSETLGPYYYNQGLQDAQTVLNKRLDSITDAIADIEQPLNHLR